jgi:hypothetical protein
MQAPRPATVDGQPKFLVNANGHLVAKYRYFISHTLATRISRISHTLATRISRISHK